MAANILLAIPVEHVEEVKNIILAGIAEQTYITPEVKVGLDVWIAEVEQYLKENE